jgi:hypothetical protein
MVKEIRVYVEGGGDSFETRAKLRRGFTIFFSKLNSELKDRIDVVACGSRDKTYRDFMIAWKDHPDSHNILLVDSETEVKTDPWTHLASQDQWSFEAHHHENCHLMAQIMEAWFLADRDALKTFYGQGFREDKLPQSQKVEKVTKDTIMVKLNAAARKTEFKRYHKIHHASKILELLDINKIRSAAHHCDLFFKTIEQKTGLES